MRISLSMSLLVFSCLIVSPVLGRENIMNNTQDITRDNTRALLYLVRYGYVAPRQGSSLLMSGEMFERGVMDAVQDFQAFAGLNQTGVLDQKTLELMETPRCGVKDIVGHGATARRKKR